ncbi:unnamed protein product [Acanthosepion pharaonis]|uniref:Uncharacterized protein n=1 Tax=Acanthosepion pharaonis TaxID=158019 RepID=A0A812E5Y3_ACAPH|nr:unnamed protein product [Sepia pharaonis]
MSYGADVVKQSFIDVFSPFLVFPLSFRLPSPFHIRLLSIYRIPLFFHLISPFLCFSRPLSFLFHLSSLYLFLPFFSSPFFTISLYFPLSLFFLLSFSSTLSFSLTFSSAPSLIYYLFAYVSLFTFLPLPLSSHILFLYFHSPTLHLFLPTHPPHQFHHSLVCHKGLFTHHSLFVDTSNLYFSF